MPCLGMTPVTPFYRLLNVGEQKINGDEFFFLGMAEMGFADEEDVGRRSEGGWKLEWFPPSSVTPNYVAPDDVPYRRKLPDSFAP